MEWPLSGLRVADLSAGIAGGYCTKALADGGAEVIKLEPPEGDLKAGDSSRGWRRAVGSRFTGRAAPSPPRAATACPAAVSCQVVHLPAWQSQTCSTVSPSGGRKRRFCPGLKAGISTP